MEERNLMLEIENIINCGRKKEDSYFSLRDKFRERIFTEPVMPAQMIFFWTLPETFESEDLDKEFSLGYKHFAADVYDESINSLIDKMREHSKNMNRLFVCPCTDNETREKILDALHIIFPERKKDVDVLYNNESTNTIPDYLKNAEMGDYLTTKMGNIILVHHIEFEGNGVKVYYFFDYSKKDERIYKNEFMEGFYGPSVVYDFYRPSTDSEIKFFTDKLKEFGYEWDENSKWPVMTKDAFFLKEHSKEVESILKSLKSLRDSDGNPIFSDEYLERKYLRERNETKHQ
jgi:hypothetical protein